MGRLVVVSFYFLVSFTGTGLPILLRLWCLRERRGRGRPLRPALSPKEMIKILFFRLGFLTFSFDPASSVPKRGEHKTQFLPVFRTVKAKSFFVFFLAKMVVTERTLKICTDYTSYIIIKLNFCLIKISLPLSPWTKTTTATVPWFGLRGRQKPEYLAMHTWFLKDPRNLSIYYFFSGKEQYPGIETLKEIFFLRNR